jgi:hypothetical protein
MVIRVNDIVKIVTPEIFIRCGYPFDQIAATDHLVDHYAEDVQALITKIDPNAKYPRRFGSGKDFRDLCGRIARIVATRDGFGGWTRSLHTERKEEWTGLRCQVRAKKVHKTGNYFPPTGGDEWYEPGGLDNEKTHVILTVSPIWFYDNNGRVNRTIFPDGAPPSQFQIERIHVEKENTP